MKVKKVHARLQDTGFSESQQNICGIYYYSSHNPQPPFSLKFSEVTCKICLKRIKEINRRFTEFLSK